jgi:hypothetical protein
MKCVENTKLNLKLSNKQTSKFGTNFFFENWQINIISHTDKLNEGNT